MTTTILPQHPASRASGDNALKARAVRLLIVERVREVRAARRDPFLPVSAIIPSSWLRTLKAWEA